MPRFVPGCGCCDGGGTPIDCCPDEDGCEFSTDSIKNLEITLSGGDTVTQSGASSYNTTGFYCSWDVPVTHSVNGAETIVVEKAATGTHPWSFSRLGSVIGRAESPTCDITHGQIIEPAPDSDVIGQFDADSPGLCLPSNPCDTGTRVGVIITITGLVDTTDDGTCSGQVREYSEYNGVYVYTIPAGTTGPVHLAVRERIGPAMVKPTPATINCTFTSRRLAIDIDLVCTGFPDTILGYRDLKVGIIEDSAVNGGPGTLDFPTITSTDNVDYSLPYPSRCRQGFGCSLAGDLTGNVNITFVTT